jgi:hypothetical protein
MDRTVHNRYLHYRECHVYFGRRKPMLGPDDFVRLDAELATLTALGDGRDDEEDERFAALTDLLHRS